MTYVAATLFMATSLVLTVMQGKTGKTGLQEKLEAASKVAEPAAAAPVAVPAAPVAVPAAAPVAVPAK